MVKTLEVLRTVVQPFIQGKTVVPTLEASRAVEPGGQAAMALSVAVRLEAREVAEFEREIPVAEFEHESPMAEVTEVPRLEVWGMSELEHEILMAEVTEVPRLDVSVFAEDAPLMELEAMMRPMKFCASMWGEMAEAYAAIAGLNRLRRHRNRRDHCCRHQDPAHRLAPSSSAARLLNLVPRGAPDTTTPSDSSTHAQRRREGSTSSCTATWLGFAVLRGGRAQCERPGRGRPGRELSVVGGHGPNPPGAWLGRGAPTPLRRRAPSGYEP